jgi:hypothetical protein
MSFDGWPAPRCSRWPSSREGRWEFSIGPAVLLADTLRFDNGAVLETATFHLSPGRWWDPGATF